MPLQRTELRIKDPMSGFFIVRREAIDGLSFENKGFKLLLEILVRARIVRLERFPFTSVSDTRVKAKRARRSLFGICTCSESSPGT